MVHLSPSYSMDIWTEAALTLCVLQRVNSLHLSAGSRYLISGGTDRTVRVRSHVWDLKRQHLKHSFPACNSAIRSVTFTGQTDEFIVAGCDSGDIYLYHAQQGTAAGICRDRDDASAIQAVQSSSHPFVRNKLGTVQLSGTLCLWDVATASLVSNFPRLVPRFTEVAAAMHEIKVQMAHLLAENDRLRQENERLKHIF
ncbi:hypothetical protein DYB37_011704 [Aphanomyces astaci]|uniref:Anaphase-promoting complex subunit 4 WD40 domain-containing protein n=1 Tax=Aphanomyces astaci TaxID=112090 RepID=A0A418FIG9_APHAT|nr:hypothetical protein DYB37_011704 [Aphanomyces astaci]